MKMKEAIFGESSVTKVAGLFSSQADARRAAESMTRRGTFRERQVSVLGPADPPASDRVSRSLEPEIDGIGITLVRAHVLAGLLGGGLGVGVYSVLLSVDSPMVLSSPGISLIAMMMLGTAFGLLAGGLVSLRPDHNRVGYAVRRALRRGQWAVIVHPVDRRQVDLAKARLARGSYKVVRTL